MIPDLSVSRPAKSFTFLCGRLRSIRHGRKTCGRPQTCRKHTLEANFYFRPDCLGGKTFAKTPLAEVVSPVPPALGHRDRVGEMFRHFRLAELSPFARHTEHKHGVFQFRFPDLQTSRLYSSLYAEFVVFGDMLRSTSRRGRAPANNSDVLAMFGLVYSGEGATEPLVDDCS